MPRAIKTKQKSASEGRDILSRPDLPDLIGDLARFVSHNTGAVTTGGKNCSTGLYKNRHRLPIDLRHLGYRAFDTILEKAIECGWIMVGEDQVLLPAPLAFRKPITVLSSTSRIDQEGDSIVVQIMVTIGGKETVYSMPIHAGCAFDLLMGMVVKEGAKKDE